MCDNKWEKVMDRMTKLPASPAVKFQGRPLSAIMPIQGTAEGQENMPPFWLWARLTHATPVEGNLALIDSLVERGWMQAPDAHIAQLETQLYDFLQVRMPDGSIQLWYEPGSHPTIVPVVLVFSVPNHVQHQQISMLNYLPLPQHGEYAYVTQDDSLSTYSVLHLSLEARQRWANLGDALRRLAEPGAWPPFTERHKLASNPVDYQKAINEIVTKERLVTGQAKADLRVRYVALEAARLSIESFREALSKPNWVEQWHEVQRMAQDLAHDYYEHHQHQQARLTVPLSSPLQEQDEQSEPPPTPITALDSPGKRRGRRPGPRTPDTAIVAKKQDSISIKSDMLNHELIKGLRDKDKYTPYEEHGVAEYKNSFNKERGQLMITIRPQAGESWDTVISALNTLGDDCVDTYVAVMAIALDANGSEHIRTPIQVSPDDILALRGKVKSHGSYTPFQRAEVIKHLKTLSQAHIIATMPAPARFHQKGKGKRGRQEETFIRAEGAIIDLLSWRIGEYKTITGEEIWEKRSIAIGAWITMIPQFNHLTATMLRQVLAYSAKNERYQKRLGIYLTFMFRINAKRGGVFECSTHALLEGAGIVPDKKHPEHFMEMFENALADLQGDRVIGEYTRIIESDESEQRINERARYWWEVYEQQHWKFTPPDETQRQYALLSKVAGESDA